MSEKTMHTPGPWFLGKIDREAGTIAVDCIDKDGDEALMCILETADGIDPEDEADARLIAAAPELLDALKRVTEQLDEAYGETYVVRQARAVIAKATGGDHAQAA